MPSPVQGYRLGVSEQDDLIGGLIAEVARTHGIAISCDDPVIAVVLRCYLEETLAPTAAAIREATREAVAEIEQIAQAQARWLEQVSLKDRASFLEEQKALHKAWKADMKVMIAGQNGPLRQVVTQTAARLRAQIPSPIGGTGTQAPPPAQPIPSRFRKTCLWGWLSAGMFLGMVAAVVLWLTAPLCFRAAAQ